MDLVDGIELVIACPTRREKPAVTRNEAIIH